MACGLDSHPIIDKIDSMLRQGDIPYGAILAFCADQSQTVPQKHQLSRHSMGCLKLVARGPRKKQKVEVQEMDSAEMSEVIEEGLKIFLWRLKNTPEAVKTSELVPVLTAAMRLKDQGAKKSNLLERLSQIQDAYSEPSEGDT